MAWRYSWFWGLGLYLSSLFWIGNSLWIEPERFALFWPIVVMIIPSILACYLGVIGLIFTLFVRSQLGLFSLFLVFSSLLSAMEFAAGHFLTGFPWNLVAYIWAPCLPVSQGAAFVGSYGMGLVTILLALLPALGYVWGKKRGLFYGTLTTIGLVFGGFFLGQKRLETPLTCHKDIVLRLVQPGFDQKEKNQPQRAHHHLRMLKELSNDAFPCSHIIWSESALPWCWSAQSLLNSHAVLGDLKAPLLAGGCFFQEENKGPWLKGFYNGLFSKKQGENIVFWGGKNHLVPFGEYIPLRAFLSRYVPASWLRKITPGSEDYQKAPRKIFMHCEGLPPFRLLVCYESIFPGTLRLEGQEDPQWALNLTNNAWFGASSGPLQHFESTRFRAIEEGFPVVCVANTGPSGMIDPMGRVPLMLRASEKGILDCPLYHALPRTFFGYHGHKIWWVMQAFLWCFIGGIFGIQSLRNRKIFKKQKKNVSKSVQ